MVQGFIADQQSGQDVEEALDDFRDDIETVKAHIPEALNRALNKTAEDFKVALTNEIKRSSTAKGGTFNSETSKYSPGGTNESSDDGFHMDEIESWDKRNTNIRQVRVFPNDAIEDRAKWMEYGTADHGPTGDTPMYFNVGGATIIVADKPDRGSAFYKPYVQQSALDNTEGAQFNFGVPGEVEGVEENHFFDAAADKIRRNNTMEKNLELFVKQIFEREFPGAIE